MPTRPGSRGSSGSLRAGARVVQADLAGHRPPIYARCGHDGWPASGRPGRVYKVPCHARRAAPRPAPRAARRGLPHAARALPRRPGGLRRHLPRPPGRRGPHVGGALHDPRRARAQGLHAARARRRHRHRRRRPGWPCARASCRASTPSGSACSTPAATSTWRSASRACSACPTGARRWCASTTCALPGRRVSTLTMGDGPDVVCIHGLGATKASFFDTAAALTRAGYRVHALDLPGFGGSSKPVAGPYSARWFADTVVEVMDALDIGRAHLVGNSMGGRVAIEVGLRAPERVAGLALLAPGRGLRQARLAPDRAPAAPRARPAAPQPRPQPRRAPVLEPVRRSRPGRSERGRPRRRRVPAHLRERRRAAGLPHRGAQHLPRPPLRARRLLPAAGRARGALALRLGRVRPPHPARLQAPRGAVAARRRADRPRGLRPRAAGRALRADDRAAAALLRARRRAAARAARRARAA